MRMGPRPRPPGKSGVTAPTPPLRKLQRNDIITAIRAAGLDPAELPLEKLFSDTAQIKHGSGSYFNVSEGLQSRFTGISAIGDDPPRPFTASSWSIVVELFKAWLAGVKRDLATPDLWAELQNEARLFEFDSTDPAENTPFTREEQAQIARQLQEIAENARTTYSLSGAQMQALDEKLSYLVDAAGRLGRTDWRGLVIGTMLSFALSIALPPEPARHIFFSVLRVIGHRYGFPELGGG
jgi:hypothetical protein